MHSVQMHACAICKLMLSLCGCTDDYFAVQTHTSCNQLTVMFTTRGEGTALISIQCQKECVESKLDGQTDAHGDYSAHLPDVQNVDTRTYSVVIDNFDLHIFPFNIDFVNFDRFLCYKLSQ